MSTLLVGSEVINYPEPAFLFADHAFQFTAVASGTLDTLELFVVDGTDLSDLYLALYADSSDSPAARLAYGAVPSPASYVNAWAPVTGLSAAITAGTKYWLEVTPIGAAVESLLAYRGGLEVVTDNGAAYTTAPGNPWRGIADGTVSRDHGPIGFRGMVGGPGGPGITEEIEPDVLAMRDSGLEWHVTGLWYPDADSVAYYGRVADPTDDRVEIPLDGASTAQVTLSTLDPVADAVAVGKTYQRCLRAYYRGHLVFWGPIKLRETDADAGTVTWSAVDPSLRLQRHQLRRGDLLGGLNAENDDKSQVPVDHTGLRLLRDAGLNTTEQTARGVPDLGIIDGTNDYVATPFNLMGVSRGDQVWSQMVQLSQSLGPDFELEPIQDTVGAYCQLNTFIKKGDNISHVVGLHWGTGKQNLDNIRDTEGGQYTTHAHVLPRDLHYRFTQANADASAETGPYVDWDATDYDSAGIDPTKVEEVLRAFGDDILNAYSRPLHECALVLPVEDETSYLYLRDYVVGDTIAVAARADLYDLDSLFYRIALVRLIHDGTDDNVRVELEVVSDRAAELADSIGAAGTGDD